MMQLITLFQQQGWRITFATAAAYSEHAADIAAQGVTPVAIQLNHPSFDQFVRELTPDIVVFDRFMSEEQFGWRVAEQCPAALRILNTEDLHFLRKARHAVVKAGGIVGYSAEIPPQKQLYSDAAKREIAAILRCDLSIIISEVEIALLTNIFKIDAALLHHTPFLPALHINERPSFIERQHFVTIGNFRHAPNWDSVLQLKETIWPRIRPHLPEAQLHIYGAYPPPKATALHNPRERFFVQGWADNAQTVMLQARVCLAPLRFGAGLKGKLLTALQCGTPSVTTPIGAEGMAGALPWGGMVAESPDSFAEAAIELYQDKAIWRGAQASGDVMLCTRFDSAEHGLNLINRIVQLRTDLDAQRTANFMGALLHHHTLQSTRYLSRWIEAKNREKSAE